MRRSASWPLLPSLLSSCPSSPEVATTLAPLVVLLSSLNEKAAEGGDENSSTDSIRWVDHGDEDVCSEKREVDNVHESLSPASHPKDDVDDDGVPGKQIKAIFQDHQHQISDDQHVPSTSSSSSFSSPGVKKRVLLVSRKRLSSLPSTSSSVAGEKSRRKMDHKSLEHESDVLLTSTSTSAQNNEHEKRDVKLPLLEDNCDNRVENNSDGNMIITSHEERHPHELMVAAAAAVDAVTAASEHHLNRRQQYVQSTHSASPLPSPSLLSSRVSDQLMLLMMFPEEENLILRELSEMKAILEKLLETRQELAAAVHDVQLHQNPQNNNFHQRPSRPNHLPLTHGMTLTPDNTPSAEMLTLFGFDPSSGDLSLPRGIYPSSPLVSLASSSSSTLDSQEMMLMMTGGIGSTSSVSSSTVVKREPVPHYPIGEYEYLDCGICLLSQWLYKRPCCGYPVCSECLSIYFRSKIEMSIVTIECINDSCKSFVHRDEISSMLTDVTMKNLYYRLLILESTSSDGLSRTCPQCNHLFSIQSSDALKKMKKSAKSDATASRVICGRCCYLWCFPCGSPWHEGLSCKEYMKGDRLLQSWAKQMNHGQVNAQKCPKCKIFIQRSSGCDHMHCTRCKTDFCYRCGDQLRRLKFFGDHYSKLSVFGCKYRYRASQPFQRKLIRGAVFGSKLMAAPVLGSLALAVGACIVTVGVAALPLYGGLRMYRKYQNKKYLSSQKSLSNSDAASGISKVSTAAQTYFDDHEGDEDDGDDGDLDSEFDYVDHHPDLMMIHGSHGDNQRRVFDVLNGDEDDLVSYPGFFEDKDIWTGFRHVDYDAPDDQVLSPNVISRHATTPDEGTVIITEED